MGKNIKNQSLVELAWGRLRDDIVFDFYSPADKLNIETLKKRYEMGGTPIREALNRLVVEGLVEALPLRGFRVSLTSIEQGRDVLESRGRIELFLIEKALAGANDEWESLCIAALHRMRRCVEHENFQLSQGCIKWIDLSRRFISELYSLNRSSWLTGAYSGLYLHYMRYEYQVFSAQERPTLLIQAQYESYEKMMSFFLDRKIEDAQACLGDYIDRFIGLVERSFGGGDNG
jgi:GntR family transcriptional regulator, carbon starvation induced regulator